MLIRPTLTCPSCYSSRGVDMHLILLDSAPTGNQFNDTANVSANVRNSRGGVAAFNVAADEFVFAHVDDLKIFFVLAAFEVMLRSRCRAIQVVFQCPGDFDPDEQ